MKIYSDILAEAVEPTNYPEPIDLWETDHGYLTDKSFAKLVKRRLSEKFKHESYVREIDGETWQFNPDGTKLLVRDRFGNRVI